MGGKKIYISRTFLEGYPWRTPLDYSSGPGKKVDSEGGGIGKLMCIVRPEVKTVVFENESLVRCQ